MLPLISLKLSTENSRFSLQKELEGCNFNQPIEKDEVDVKFVDKDSSGRNLKGQFQQREEVFKSFTTERAFRVTANKCVRSGQICALVI